MRKDDPLSKKEIISVSDLEEQPLIVPRAAAGLLSSDPAFAKMKIVTIYNLIYNASLFVEDRVGYAVGFDGLINVTGDSALTFRPLETQILQAATVIWKRYESFTPAVNLFLDYMKSLI